MNITDYLKSQQARADLAELLAKTPDPAGGRGRWHAIPVPLASLTAMPDRAWTRVDILFAEIDAAHPSRVYFRPEGDRFIVTDLGEAVHALRRRTAVDLLSIDRLARGALGNLGYPEKGPWLCVGNELIILSGDDLPAAICRVLLAAHTVSNLDIKK